MMILAEKITNLRKQMNLSQEQLAEKLNVSRQSVSKWESAQSMPDTGKIIQLAEIFGVTTDYLLREDLDEVEVSLFPSDESLLRHVSMEEANEFLEKNEQKASAVSTAVALFVLSVVPILFFSGAENALTALFEYNTSVAIGLISFFVILAIGIAVAVQSAMRMKKFEYLEKELLDTAYGVTGMVRTRKESYAEKHTTRVIIGIVLSALSATPVLFTTLVYDGDEFLSIYGVIGLLVMVAAGVYFLLKTGIIWNGFQMLLQEEDYTREKKQTGRKIASLSGIYWLIATAAYLCYSFITMDWGRSWIVWPIAGILWPIVVILYGAKRNKA